MWLSKQSAIEIEVMWWQIIRTFLWSIWLLSSRFIKFGFNIEPWVFFWPMHLVSSHLTYQTPYYLRHRVSRVSIYKSERYFSCGIYLYFVYLLGYEVIILKYYLVTRSELLVGRNQISYLVKLSALSSVLIRIYWLDDKALPSVCHWY